MVLHCLVNCRGRGDITAKQASRLVLPYEHTAKNFIYRLKLNHMSCKENQTFTFLHSLLRQWPGTMVWLSCVNTWTVCWRAKPPGFLLEKLGMLLELSLSKGMIPISIWKRSQVGMMHTEMRDFGISLKVFFIVFANTHTNKLSDLYESLSAGTGI